MKKRMTVGAMEKLLELRALDLRAAENRCADLESQIQLLKLDLLKTQEYREELQSRLDEASRRANGRARVLHAIQSMVEASP